MKRYYRVTYQWPIGARGAKESTIAVEDVGTKTEQKDVAIQKLSNHIGQTVHVLDCFDTPHI